MNKWIFVILLSILIVFSFNVTATQNQWQGQPLSSFSLLDQNAQKRTNKDFLGKWLVLYFYPKDKTPGCTVEAQNFTDDYPKYQQLNSQIVGVSYDSVSSHKDFADTYQMPFVLLADTEKTLSKKMQVDRIFPLPHASRQTFLINPEGIIVKHFKSVTPSTHSKEILQTLTAIQN